MEHNYNVMINFCYGKKVLTQCYPHDTSWKIYQLYTTLGTYCHQEQCQFTAYNAISSGVSKVFVSRRVCMVNSDIIIFSRLHFPNRDFTVQLNEDARTALSMAVSVLTAQNHGAFSVTSIIFLKKSLALHEYSLWNLYWTGWISFEKSRKIRV